MTDNFGPQPMAVTNEPEVLPEEPSAQSGLDPVEVLSIIWAKRKIVLILSFGVALLTLGILFLFPNYYRAVSTILPETERSKLSGLGQFADVAQLAGVSIPGSEIARLYPSIVNSETVLENVLERKYETKRFPSSVNLIEYFHLDEGTPQKDLDEGLKRLRGLITTSYETRTGIVTLTLDMREPQLSADVLNAVVAELDHFMRWKKITNASEQRKWVETRLKQVEQDLHNSEDQLKDFREKNRRVLDSPELLLQQQRLARAVEINSTLFVELKKQYELAKIEEIKNIPIVNVLDPARAPVRKAGPKRATNTVLMFLLTLVGTSGYFVVRQKYQGQISSILSALKGTKSRLNDN
jgi:uncharacterized protein involved in exopolysaccharide biosynthesis